MTNEYYHLNNNKLSNNLIDNSEFANGIINNTRMNSSEINMSEINDPTINNPYINNLSTTGDIRFTGKYTENKNTYNREPFVLLLDKTKNAEDQLLINTSGTVKCLI